MNPIADSFLTVSTACSFQVVDEKILFVKVHMPWEVLCTYAEVLHIKLPIQANDLASKSSPFSCFTKYFYPSEDVIATETEFFTAPFEKNRLEYFIIKDQDEFFKPAMRSRMVGAPPSR